MHLSSTNGLLLGSAIIRSRDIFLVSVHSEPLPTVKISPSVQIALRTLNQLSGISNASILICLINIPQSFYLYLIFLAVFYYPLNLKLLIY
jgi:hypothetical protein